MKTQKSQKLFKLKKKKTFPREVKKHFETKMDILHTNLPGCSKSSTKKKVHRNSYVNNNKRTQINNLLYTSSRSVVSDSLKPRGLYSPWNSPGKNTGVGSRSLLQGIFPTQGWNPGLPCCRGILYQLGHFPGSSDGKESACNLGDQGSIPGRGRPPGEENGNPLQDSCLENSMNRGAWRATVHEVARVRHN